MWESEVGQDNDWPEKRVDCIAKTRTKRKNEHEKIAQEFKKIQFIQYIVWQSRLDTE